MTTRTYTAICGQCGDSRETTLDLIGYDHCEGCGSDKVEDHWPNLTPDEWRALRESTWGAPAFPLPRSINMSTKETRR